MNLIDLKMAWDFNGCMASYVWILVYRFDGHLHD